MLEFLSTPTAQAVLSVSFLMIMMAVAYYVLRSFHGRSGQDQQPSEEWLTNFEEMRQEGDITEAEFRTIKTVLNNQSPNVSTPSSFKSRGPADSTGESNLGG